MMPRARGAGALAALPEDVLLDVFSRVPPAHKRAVPALRDIPMEAAHLHQPEPGLPPPPAAVIGSRPYRTASSPRSSPARVRDVKSLFRCAATCKRYGGWASSPTRLPPALTFGSSSRTKTTTLPRGWLQRCLSRVIQLAPGNESRELHELQVAPLEQGGDDGHVWRPRRLRPGPGDQGDGQDHGPV